MPEPRWLLESLVLAIHRRQLAEHGGKPGVRDPGMLASALARPQHAWTYADPRPDVAALAAAYAFGIARNHPFIDGNKRVAYVACRTFVLLNGADLDASPEEKYVAFLGLADGRISEGALASWLREKMRLQ